MDSWDILEQACLKLHAPNKDHPDLQKPLLASAKSPLSSHSWQSRFLKGQVENNKAEQSQQESRTDILQELC